MPKLSLQELTKQYHGGFSYGPVSIEVPEGATVAVFGRNGAGKSTMFQMITGNSDRTSGNVFWGDQKISPDAVDVKRRMGYLPQESDLPAWVTPQEILNWCAKLHQMDATAVQDSLERWDITSWSKRPLAACSHGMQKRVGLALATMHDPELLILDEAFNALDILHTRTLELMIRSRAKTGKTTLISTHTPLLAASLCDSAWILDAGKLKPLTKWIGAGLEARTTLIEDEFFAKHH